MSFFLGFICNCFTSAKITLICNLSMHILVVTQKKNKYLAFKCYHYPTGECWSGSNAAATYQRGGQSDYCLTTEFASCDPTNKMDCVGNATTVFVYGITEEEGRCAICGVLFQILI